MHPAVCAWLSDRAAAAFEGADVVVVDAAALIESGFADRCDLLAVVTAPEAVRLARIMARDGLTEEAARLRMNAQKPEAWYVDRADYVIVNDGGPLAGALRPLCGVLFAD
jgi:dephospho-CoA kinase